jgi:hypothetical protein
MFTSLRVWERPLMAHLAVAPMTAFAPFPRIHSSGLGRVLRVDTGRID